MQKILLDTNFLLIPAQFKVDIFSEIDRIFEENYALYVPEEVVEELKDIAKSKDRAGLASKLTLALIAKKNVNIIKKGRRTNIGADNRIIELSGKEYIVATQDRELRKKLRAEGVKILALRQTSHITIIG